MAKSKSKNDIKIVSIKKNTNVVKKGANVMLVKSKPSAKGKKRISVPDIEKTDEKKNVTQDDITRRKERNRKKYQNQQKKYLNNKNTKPKKKITVETEENKPKVVQEETIIKKKDKETPIVKKKQTKKIDERRVKRKTNALAQTIVNIKTISADTINTVKEKTDDRKIPVGTSKDEKKQRFKRVVREALVYAILLTLINVLLAIILDDVNFLRLFDVKILNVIVTIMISMIFNFCIAFAIDYLITSLWLVIRRKKSGDENGDSRINNIEHREDIEN